MSFLERFFTPAISFTLPSDAGTRTLRMLECSGRDMVARSVAADGWQGFEPPMPDVFYRACNACGGLVLDVGANSGFYALLAAAARADVRVIAFEPDPNVKPILDRNIDLNRFRRRITPLPTAVSDRAGVCDLFIPRQDHGLVETSSSLESTFKKGHSDVLRVKTDTIDGVVRRLPPGLRDVTIIKIDVEGHEAAVLRGALSTIQECRPLLFVEVLSRADLVWLNAFLRDNSYLEMPLKPTGEQAIGDTVAYDPEAWNHLFVPMERAGQIG